MWIPLLSPFTDKERETECLQGETTSQDNTDSKWQNKDMAPGHLTANHSFLQQIFIICLLCARHMVGILAGTNNNGINIAWKV